MTERFEWLAYMINFNTYRVGAEVGCRSGATTSHILKYCPTLELLYCVDMWNILPEEYQTEYWKNVYSHTNSRKFRVMRSKFDLNIKPYLNRVHILQGLSWSMADKLSDGVLDFVFIDADHAHESVKKDIKAWLPKIVKGGVLCGHDDNLKGVVNALDELVPDWQSTGVGHTWFKKVEDD